MVAFIADGSGRIVAHYNPAMIGKSLAGLLGTDTSEITEEGGWVSYEDVNPATGKVEPNHTWVVSHDGMTFGSGWHNDETN